MTVKLPETKGEIKVKVQVGIETGRREMRMMNRIRTGLGFKTNTGKGMVLPACMSADRRIEFGTVIKLHGRFGRIGLHPQSAQG